METILDPCPADRPLYLSVATLAVDCGVRGSDNSYTFEGVISYGSLDIQALGSFNPRQGFRRRPTWLSIGVRAIDFAKPTSNGTLSTLQLWGNMEDNGQKACSARHLRLDFRTSDDRNNDGLAVTAELVSSAKKPQLTPLERQRLSRRLAMLTVAVRTSQILKSMPADA